MAAEIKAMFAFGEIKAQPPMLIAAVFIFSIFTHQNCFAAKVANRVELLPSYFFESLGQGTNQLATPIKAESSLSFKPSNRIKFRLTPWLYSDPVSFSRTERFYFDLNEAYADWAKGKWNIKVGINSVAWGVTDVYNPLDVVSARRYTDLMNVENRGVPSFDIKWEGGSWRLEGIYVPVQLESVLPGEKSRWLPRDIGFTRGTVEGEMIFTDRLQYSYLDRQELDDALKNNFGFRFERRGSRVDVTGIFFQGAPVAPAVFTPIIDADLLSSKPGSPNLYLASNVSLRPVYYLRRTVGVGAVLTLESTIVRLAYANSDRVTQKVSLPGWSQSAVLGIEHSFSIKDSTLVALLQGTYASHEDRADNSVTSLDRVFDRSLLMGLKLLTSSEWNYSLAGLYDSWHQGGYSQMKLERRIKDGVTASLQADWLDGRSGTPLGTYRKNKRATVGLTVFF